MAQQPRPGPPLPAPRLYLVTPQVNDTAALADILPAALEAADIAAVLLRLAPADERTLIKRAKALAAAVQGKDVALIVDGHPEIAIHADADGCHISDISVLRDTAAKLKPARILGAGGLATRDDAMTAGETGADYVMFGEPDEEGQRPSFAAIVERVAWWAEVFEIPCVAYAARIEEIDELCTAGADFIALGDLVFDDPRGCVAAVAEAAEHLKVRTPA
ncbi:MAG: thiamine phosphate synthase [Xanthobacteraceae bacterium]